MTRTGGRTAWCVACHHLVRLTFREGYLHVSDDDWSAFSCPCANQLRPCVPEPRLIRRLRRQAPSYTEAVDRPPKEQP